MTKVTLSRLHEALIKLPDPNFYDHDFCEIWLEKEKIKVGDPIPEYVECKTFLFKRVLMSTPRGKHFYKWRFVGEDFQDKLF